MLAWKLRKTAHQRYYFRYHCFAMSALLSIALAITHPVGPEQGTLHCHYRQIFVSFFWRKPVQLIGPTAAFCCDYLRNCRTVRNWRTDVADVRESSLWLAGDLPFWLLIENTFPYTITTGFTCGIAVTLFVGQLKISSGLEIASSSFEVFKQESLLMYKISARSTSPLQSVGVVAVSLCCSGQVTDKIPRFLMRQLLSQLQSYILQNSGKYNWQCLRLWIKFRISNLQPPALSMKLVQGNDFTCIWNCHPRRYWIHTCFPAVVSDGMIVDTQI